MIWSLFQILLWTIFLVQAMAEEPRCSQDKMSVDDLNSLASSKSVNSMQDFLDQIPKAAMQRFTLVTNSLSLQRGAGDGTVSPMWPRVLRASEDGKMTISFVCDPRNPSFGKVEALYFDDSSNEVKSVEWDFTNPNSSNRVHKNPIDCVSCHKGSSPNGKPSLKFNWSEYFSWGDCKRERGITLYGSNDDSMKASQFRKPQDLNHNPKDCKNLDYQAAHAAEVVDYRKFREKQKGNSCFNSLPWMKKPSPNSSAEELEKYDAFPYSSNNPLNSPKEVRPNLHFTKAYSHLMAKRIFQLIKRDGGQYDRMKYFLLMEDLGCRLKKDEADATEILTAGPYDPPKQHYDSSDPSQDSPLLYRFSRRIGLKDSDWTMQFHLENDPSYSTAIGLMGHLIAGEILSDLKTDDKPFYDMLREKFPKNFNETSEPCLNQVSSTIIDQLNPDKTNQICEALRDENLKKNGDYKNIGLVDLNMCQSKSNPLKELAIGTRALNAEVRASINRGQQLVQADSKGKCVLCHSAGADSGLPSDFRFVPDRNGSSDKFDESKSVLHARVKDGFLDTLTNRLITTKTMPPFPNALSDQDRDDIKAYLENLAPQ